MSKKIVLMMIVIIIILSSFSAFIGYAVTTDEPPSEPPKEQPKPEPPKEEPKPEPPKEEPPKEKPAQLTPSDFGKYTLDEKGNPVRVGGQPVWVTNSELKGKVPAYYNGKMGTYDTENKVFVSNDLNYQFKIYETGTVETYSKEGKIDSYTIRDDTGVELGTFSADKLPAGIPRENIPLLLSELRANGLDFNDKSSEGTYAKGAEGERVQVTYDAQTGTISTFSENTQLYITKNAKTGEVNSILDNSKGGIKYEYGTDSGGNPTLTVTKGNQVLYSQTAQIYEGKILYPIGTTEKDVWIYVDENGGLRHYDGTPLSSEETAEVLANPELKGKHDAVTAGLDERNKAKKGESLSSSSFKKGFINAVEFLTQFLRYYSLYSGLAAYGSLFFNKDNLEERRAKVEKEFCDTILLGGTQCWTSKLCQQYIDSAPGEGVLVTEDVGGAFRAVAHVEGEKSLPIETPKGSQWVYKVNYYISNNDEQRKFNVKFTGDKTTFWYAQEDPKRNLKPGEASSRASTNPILKASSSNYKEVCLVFIPTMSSFNGRRVDELCSAFSQYRGEATEPYKFINQSEEEQKKKKGKKGKEDKEEEEFEEGTDV